MDEFFGVSTSMVLDFSLFVFKFIWLGIYLATLLGIPALMAKLSEYLFELFVYHFPVASLYLMNKLDIRH